MDMTIDEVTKSAIASPLPVRPGTYRTKTCVKLFTPHHSAILIAWASEPQPRTLSGPLEACTTLFLFTDLIMQLLNISQLRNHRRQHQLQIRPRRATFSNSVHEKRQRRRQL